MLRLRKSLLDALLDNKIYFVITFVMMLLLTSQAFSQEVADADETEIETEIVSDENGDDDEIETDTTTAPPPPRRTITPRETIFLGLIDKSGASVQADFERAIRLELAASPHVALVGELETQRVVREIERLNRTRAEHFIPHTFPLADSAVVIRIITDEPVVRLGRSWLIFGKINVTTSIRIIFREHNGQAAYDGEFSASSSMRKGWLFFTPVRRGVHVSAPERSRLVGEAQSDIIGQFNEFVRLFYNSLD